MIKDILQSAYKNAEDLNTDNVITAIKSCGHIDTLLDIGCWDGEVTLKWKQAANAIQVFGIEPIEHAAVKAKDKGITVHSVPAESVWPIEDASIDCIVSNQVIEHLSDVDILFSQASRVLKTGGYIVTSTNNLASIHNILSIICGFAPFDLSNSSKKVSGIGNPFALHKGTNDPRGGSWTHKCIYTPKWLFDWQKLYGLEPINYYGAGFYPFPAKVGSYLKPYSAFITLVCKKSMKKL